jgi:hypothetical protein
MGVFASGLARLWGHFQSPPDSPLGVRRQLHSSFFNAPTDNAPAKSYVFGDGVDGKALLEFFQNGGADFSAQGSVSAGGFFSASAANIVRGQPRVSKTTFKHSLGKAKMLSKLGGAIKLILNRNNLRDNGRALKLPVVSFPVVRSVRRFHYSGPVYNFESESNVLLSNGIVNHNCGCLTIYRIRMRRDG